LLTVLKGRVKKTKLTKEEREYDGLMTKQMMKLRRPEVWRRWSVAMKYAEPLKQGW